MKMPGMNGIEFLKQEDLQKLLKSTAAE